MKRVILICVLFLSGCGSGNLDYVKSHAEETFKANGFEIIGYQGYNWTPVIPFTSYGGACAWYTISRNKITYEACLARWGEEIHLYGLKVQDVAFKEVK
jgi:hypothetical protein